jgi:hypothetical protein
MSNYRRDDHSAISLNEKMFFPGESIEEQILSLNSMYLSLLDHGASSEYFLFFKNELAVATL